MLNRERNHEIFKKIFSLEEFYSLEDYDNYLMFQTNRETKTNFIENIEITCIRVTFQFNNKSKEFIMTKKNLKKIYAFIKIIYNDNYINILIFRNNQYDSNNILNRINNAYFLKGPIIRYLKAESFPLTNFFLEEQKNINDDNEYDKIYILKKNNFNINNNNNMLNKNNLNRFDNIQNRINNNMNMNFNNFQMNNNMNIQNMNNFNNNLNQMNMNNLINQPNNMIQINNNMIRMNNNLNQLNNNNMNFINNNINQNININNMNNNLMNNNFNKNDNDFTTLFTNSNKNDFFSFIGLKNIGINTYLNSILQCLLHIPELNNFFINIYPKQQIKLRKINFDSETGGLLSKKYYNLVINIYNNNNDKLNNSSSNEEIISPKNFNDTLIALNPNFCNFELYEPKDLLFYLFQAMHEELNFYGDKKLEKIPKCNQLIEKESFDSFMTVNSNLNLSIFSYLFYGILKTQTICLGCHSKFYNFQSFQYLNFPTFNFKDREFNIYQGFKEFIEPEIVKGDNQCYCQKCKGLRDAKIFSKIYYTPPYLIINIDYGKDKKYIPRKVNFGQSILLNGFEDKKCTELDYELIAVSTQIGKSGNNVHYISKCKHPNREWYEFNDSYVKKINFEELNNNFICLLIYKKIKKI